MRAVRCERAATTLGLVEVIVSYAAQRFLREQLTPAERGGLLVMASVVTLCLQL